MNDYLAHSLKAISREYGGIKIFLETMTLSDIRDDPQWWNMQNIYQYFSTSSCYFILCHPHQSAEGLQWPPHQFYSGLQCLRSKIGFPRGEQMLCPVFTQNKGLYLLLANQYCNPTLIIDLEDWRNQAGKDDAFFQKKGLISR
jgi:hypothetical protein